MILKCLSSLGLGLNGCVLFASCLGLFVLLFALGIELTEMYILYFAIIK